MAEPFKGIKEEATAGKIDLSSLFVEVLRKGLFCGGSRGGTPIKDKSSTNCSMVSSIIGHHNEEGGDSREIALRKAVCFAWLNQKQGGSNKNVNL